MGSLCQALGKHVRYKSSLDSFVIISTKLCGEVCREDDAARRNWSSFSVQALVLRSVLEMTLGLTLKKKKE